MVDTRASFKSRTRWHPRRTLTRATPEGVPTPGGGATKWDDGQLDDVGVQTRQQERGTDVPFDVVGTGGTWSVVVGSAYMLDRKRADANVGKIV